MKKINKNSLTFFFVMIFMFAGLCGKSFQTIIGTAEGALNDISHGNFSKLISYENSVNKATNSDLIYHDSLVGVNSIKENLLGTRVVFKNDMTVVKADSGRLVDTTPKMTNETLINAISKICELKTVAENNNAHFLYCATLKKSYYETYPDNVEDFYKENYRVFIDKIEKSHIDYLELRNMLNDIEKSGENRYFNSDHHWTPYAAFKATGTICKALNEKFGFIYNKDYVDINYYEVKTYNNWFLGSLGKKTGQFFSWNGADDFDVFTPLFQTDLTSEEPFKNESRSGEFSDTVLHLDNMKKDYYSVNTYSVYNGGNYRLQIISNKLNPNGKKILLIGDSFDCAVVPFLSLQTSQLHICDVRNMKGLVGEKVNIKNYIEEIRPDYVLVLYADIQDDNFDFF